MIHVGDRVIWRVGVVVAAVAGLGAQAPAARAIWTLEAPNRIVEHDAATFAARQTVLAPPRVFEHPEYLEVNARGQVLFTGEPGVMFGGGDMADAADRAWVWDGRAGHEFPRDDEPGTVRQWFLSSTGDALYAVETHFAVTRDADGLDRSVRTSGRVWRTDLAGGHRQVALDLPPLPPCTCTTGTCSESCPEWEAWAPDGAIGAFLLLTRFVPGQLQADYQASTVYRRDGAAWRPDTLPQPLEAPLAASPDGRTFVAAIRDAGCCGWTNESSDQLVLLRGGKATTLFDEFARFANQDYDVSLYPSAARLSPDGMRVAYAVVGDAPPADAEIRLSSDGKENPEALARLRKALAGLPAVEIARLDAAGAAPVIIPHAEPVGWLGDQELLVAQDGRLVVYGAGGAKLRDTPLVARRALDAFVR